MREERGRREASGRRNEHAMGEKEEVDIRERERTV
jgi:hypothetical protein